PTTPVCASATGSRRSARASPNSPAAAAATPTARTPGSAARTHTSARSRARPTRPRRPSASAGAARDTSRPASGPGATARPATRAPALLVDERWNGGGQIPTRFVELLDRPLTNKWAVRHGDDWTWPPDGHRGPKAMLINGWAGSGGDAFPYYFRQRGLGKLVG